MGSLFPAELMRIVQSGAEKLVRIPTRKAIGQLN